MRKHLTAILCGIVFLFSLAVFASCEVLKDEVLLGPGTQDPFRPDLTEWTNDNAVYAHVKAQYADEVLKNAESAFKAYNFKKMYISQQNQSLLFILNESGADKQEEFKSLLDADQRISSAHNCRDLPFPTVDTRYLDAPIDTLKVGETLTITPKGHLSAYRQPFNFEGVWVTLTQYNAAKTYTPEDFPQVQFQAQFSAVKNYGGNLYLELEQPNYFNVIKAVDRLSRNAEIKTVEFDILLDGKPPPIWDISDTTVADYAEENGKSAFNRPLTIIGLKPGKVTIMHGVSREFTVVAPDSPIPFSVGLIKNQTNGVQYDNFTAIITEPHSDVETDLLDGFEFLRDYDEQFFAEKALIVYLFSFGTTDNILVEAKQLHKQGDKLILDINFVSISMEASHAISYWAVVLEVDKADISGAVEVEVNKTYPYVYRTIAAIHFYTSNGLIQHSEHKLYDFTQLTYSTKQGVSDYEIAAVFTQHQAEDLFSSIIDIGIFQLKEQYSTPILDGDFWSLTVTFSDGTAFTSEGYAKYPEQAESLNTAFKALSGFKLFG
ncbi:MAG: hypothetical protein FWH03_06015 [Firmicutes bacterium]|nr:hypothetical protein [Bacillota bacterium]